MKHAANTHAVDLNTGGVVCGYRRYVDVVEARSLYVTCFRCWDRLYKRGVDMLDEATRAAVPKVYLVTGLRVVRTGGNR